MNMRSKAEQALIELMKNGDEADRCYAARTLGTLHSQNAVETLIAHLTDEDIDVCVDAAEALGRIGDPTAVPPLLNSLSKEESGEVCTAVTSALGMLGGEAAIDALKKIAVERPEAIEWEDDWDRWWDVQLAAVEALGRYGIEDATELLVDIMDSDASQDIDAEIYHALSSIKQRGFEVLCERLKSPSAMHRRRAVAALGRSGSPDASSKIGQSLRDKAPEVRAAAATALAKLGAHHYLSAIVLLLRDEDEDVRSAAVEASSRLAASQGDPELLLKESSSLLVDPNSLVRTTTLKTLSGLIQPEALEQTTRQLVEQNLSHTDFNTAAAAADLLAANHASESIEPLIEMVGNNTIYSMARRHAILALRSFGINNRAIIDVLKSAVLDKDQAVRIAALGALSHLEQFPLQEDEATDQQPQRPLDIVLAAINGELIKPEESELPPISQTVEFDPEADKILPKQTEDETASDEQAATSTLAEITGATEEAATTAPLQLPEQPGRVVEVGEVNKAISTLDAIAMDNVEATLGIGQEEPTAAPEYDQETEEFLKLVEQNNRTAMRMKKNRRTIPLEDDLRILGLRVLTKQTDERAIAAMLQALNDDNNEIRYEAALAIAEAAKLNRDAAGLMNAMGSLITQLGLGDEDQQIACARALGYLGNKAAILPLLDALQSDLTQTKIEAIRALTNLALHGSDPVEADHMVTKPVSPKTIVRKIKGMLQSQKNGVRITAANALSELLQLEALADEIPDTIERLIATAFLGSGEHARPIGKILRQIDAEASAQRLLKELAEVDSSAERRFVIEMLEELFVSHSQEGQPQQAA
jgi:HEAT repeat protein